METLKINSKENIINSYGLKPTLPYDIEGILVEKNGKDIVVEKNIENIKVQYSLRLKEEIAGNIGEIVTIPKEDILSVKMEEVESEETENNQEVKNNIRRAEDILRELGLEFTKENIRLIEFLLKNNLPITIDTINSYIKSKEYIEKIVDNLDPNSFVKLMEKGINIEEENLQKVAESLEEIKNEKSFSLKRLLRLERDFTYKEAEQIAKEIYGHKMGKDVYDIIIALHREKVPITKENIDKAVEIMAKVQDLKNLKYETYVSIIKNEKIFNIENLYKINNSYTNSVVDANINAKTFETFTILKDTSVDGLKEMLMELDLEVNVENINILRAFIVNDMAMDKSSYNKIISMKNAVKELLNLLDEDDVVKLEKKGVSVLEEDIYKLVEEIKTEDSSGFNKNNLSSTLVSDRSKIEEIKKDLSILGKIKDEDLLLLIKNNEDFTIKSLREIIVSNTYKGSNLEEKTLNKVIYISTIFNTLGEELSAKLVSFTISKYGSPTLENLFMSKKEINTSGETIVPVDTIDRGGIFEEYIKARNSITVNVVKESIKESVSLENMPLNELNNYIQRKVNRYKETQRLIEEIKELRGNEERILPTILKNGLPMTIKEIKEIKSLLDNLDLYKRGKDYENNNGLINLSNGSSMDMNQEKGNKGMKDYIEIEKAADKDLVIQLPVDINDDYKNLNIIIPDINKGIDKNNMDFYLNLETSNLGRLKVEVKVIGKEVHVDIKEGNSLKGSLNLLAEELDKLGYTLNLN
ncbi:MAG TPA: DUF6240 domain-containing protein [Tissierellaceae bacterium]